MTDTSEVYNSDYARHYDTFWVDNKPERDIAKLQPELKQLQPGKRLLDVGCGTGNHCRLLSEEGWQVAGLDQSIDMLNQASAKVDNRVPLKHGDIRDTSLFPPSSFDLIYSFYCPLNYLQDREQLQLVFHNFHRWLEPDGRLCLELKVGGENLDFGGGSRARGSLVQSGHWQLNSPTNARFVELVESEGSTLYACEHELTLFLESTVTSVAADCGFELRSSEVETAGGESWFVWARI